jgi:hypothetical protein
MSLADSTKIGRRLVDSGVAVHFEDQMDPRRSAGIIDRRVRGCAVRLGDCTQPEHFDA